VALGRLRCSRVAAESLELVDAWEGSFQPLCSRAKPPQSRCGGKAEGRRMNAERAGKATRSHIQATCMRQACAVHAGRMRDVLVFSSYSARVLLVFSSCSPRFFRGRLPLQPGGSSELLLCFDRKGLAVIQTESHFYFCLGSVAACTRRGCWRLSNLAFRVFRGLSIRVLHHLLRGTTCGAFSMEMHAVFGRLGCSIS